MHSIMKLDYNNIATNVQILSNQAHFWQSNFSILITATIIFSYFEYTNMRDNEKAKRAANFNKHEINLLVDIALQYTSIIKNKETDSITSLEKKNSMG